MIQALAMSEPTQNRSARRGARRREMIRGIIPTDGSPGSRRVSRDAAWALRHRLRRHERSIEKRTITVRLKPDTTAVTFASAIQVTNVEIGGRWKSGLITREREKWWTRRAPVGTASTNGWLMSAPFAWLCTAAFPPV